MEKNLKDLKVTFEQATSSSMSKDQLKTLLKRNATNAALESLQRMQSEHTKVKGITYKKIRNATISQKQCLISRRNWDNLWERRGGSMVNGVPREVPESTQCTP